MKKWAKLTIVVIACLFFIWVLTFLALAQDNRCLLCVVLYSFKVLGIAIGYASLLFLLVWCGVNWIIEKDNE